MFATARPRLPARLLAGLLVLGASTGPAAAERLYQWQDAHTGHTQLSGRPPGWYRAAPGGGPRVLVFSRGRLVDDTAQAVSEELRLLLREEARLLAGLGDRAAPAIPAATTVEETETTDVAEAMQALVEEAQPADASPPGGREAAGTIDGRQRALEVIERFDRARMAAARAVVEALLPVEEAAPAEAAVTPANAAVTPANAAVTPAEAGAHGFRPAPE